MDKLFRSKRLIADQELKKFEALTIEVEFLTDVVKFLRLLNDAFEPMKDLLVSTTLGDVQEAVAFFVAAYQFNLDGGQKGALGKSIIYFYFLEKFIHC